MMEILKFTDMRAKDLVEKGEVILLPTETVYGIGVRFDSETGYEHLLACKHRRPDKPIAVMAGRKMDLESYFVLNDGIRRVIGKFLPGPLTLLLKAKDLAPYQTHLGTKVCGLRIPGSEALLSFLDSLSVPMQVTSANLSGHPSATDFKTAYEIFKDEPLVKAIIEGECHSKVATTIIDFTKEEPKLVRQGELSYDEVSQVYRG